MARIVIADDDATIQMELEEYFHSMDHQVVGVTDNGVTSVQMALELKSDLIFMDVMMPGEMDGITASREITRNTDAAFEYWVGPNGRFRYASPSCEEVTGYTVSEFMSNPELLNRMVHPADRELFLRHQNQKFFSKSQQFPLPSILSLFFNISTKTGGVVKKLR